MGAQDVMPRGADDILRRISNLEAQLSAVTALAGSASALATAIQTGLGNLATSGTTWAGPVASPSTVTAASSMYTPGTATADAGLTSAGVYSLDVSTLPGSRRANWTNVNGQIGYAPSSITTKNLLGPVTITASQFLACGPVVFEYLGQIDIRDNPENPNYDPTYVVPHELGHIAELLVENGCGEFVFTHEDGTPAGINYAEFAAVGFVIVGRDHEARIAALEARQAD